MGAVFGDCCGELGAGCGAGDGAIITVAATGAFAAPTGGDACGVALGVMPDGVAASCALTGAGAGVTCFIAGCTLAAGRRTGCSGSIFRSGSGARTVATSSGGMVTGAASGGSGAG